MDYIQNRLVYHMLRRIGQALMFLLGVSVVILIMSIVVRLSSTYLGNPLPALLLFMVAGLGIMAYFMAKEDVKLEEIRNERVRDRLSKD